MERHLRVQAGGTRQVVRLSRTPRDARARLCALALVAVVLTGCQGREPDWGLHRAIDSGEFGAARDGLHKRLPASPGDRDYLLRRMELGVVDLADGLPEAAEPTLTEVYQTLRTQGLNEDKTLASVVLNEDLKIWKGEPFEQALAYHYIALQKAQTNQWGDARAAANSSLFLLKDFGTNERGERMTSEDLARRAAQSDADESADTQPTGGPGPGTQDFLDRGYTPVKTDFALGYLMSGIASLALGRTDEAQDQFREAASVREKLDEVAGTLGRGQFNTVLVVDYGRGPQKVEYGPDGALAKFVPAPGYPTDPRRLIVEVESGQGGTFPAASDVSLMAADHMWNNLEDIRVAKSQIGQGLMVGGAVLSQSRDQGAQWAGLGMLLAGLVSRAGAHADTRYFQAAPQRIYVAPITVTGPGTTLALQVEGDHASRLVLAGLAPPVSPEQFQVRYVRLPAVRQALPWAGSGRVVYANDQYDGAVPGDDLPYIMGGRCVRRPSPQVLERYHRAGTLRHLTTADLENLYRAEGIALDPTEEGRRPGRHVLEGGASLQTPLAGTAGFARLFSQEHPPYRPRSRELREAISELARSTPVSLSAENGEESDAAGARATTTISPHAPRPVRRAAQ